MDRSVVLNVLALLLALSLFVGALAFQPERPSNQVEYTVEPFEDPAWEPLEYGNLTPAEREVFDAARDDPSGTYTVPADASPDGLTPQPGGIDHYSVYTENESYMLQVTHYNEEVDLLTQVVPRLVALVLAVLLGSVAAYRQFT